MEEQLTSTYIEPLTSREMDVLKLLAEGLSNQEIADALVMEVGTIKWYNTQIYGKLQVQNRKQAVTRARTLGILEADTTDPLQRLQHNLPADTLPFIGRKREMNELVQQLTSEKFRLITILGPGGMGKSRLSIEVGRHLLGYFTDGVYFVPLAAITSAEQIITTIADMIDFKFHSDQHPKQQLLDHLQKQQLLLIIDNFEHLLDHARLLTDILKAAPTISLLVTSREKLGLTGEVVYVITGLSIPYAESTEIAAHDAVKLFLEAASRTSYPIDENDMHLVARICEILGGMPLAILLAAAWLDTLSLAEIEAEIKQGLDILETTLRDAPQRHQSIEAVFDSSWQQLAAHEQAVFTRLSVFREGFTREAAQAVAEATLRDMQRLVHTSFIQHLPSERYAIHELMRQYGEAKLAASGELETVREQHAHYYTELFRPIGEAGWLGVDAKTLETYNPDYENARTAWHFYVARRDVLSLRRIIDGIWVFLDRYSRSQEAIDLFEAVLEIFQGEDSNEVKLFRGQLIALLGWFYGDIGLKAKALELTEEAVNILRPLGPTDALLLAHAGHAIFLGMANALPGAVSETQKGLELARLIGDSRWEGIFYYLMSSHCLATGKYKEAIEWVELMPRDGLLAVKGAALSFLGENARAEDYLLQALEPNRHHRYAMANIYRFLMQNAILSGNLEQAWLYFQRGLQYVDDTSYAWVALELLQSALTLFTADQQYSLGAEILCLIMHHPATMGSTRALAVNEYEDTLKSRLSEQEFAAAWERGQHIDLGDLITELMER